MGNLFAERAKTINKKKISFSQDALRTPFVVMLLPFLILFLVFTLIPIGASVVLSFFDYDVVNTPKFVAWANCFRLRPLKRVSSSRPSVPLPSCWAA